MFFQIFLVHIEICFDGLCFFRFFWYILKFGSMGYVFLFFFSKRFYLFFGFVWHTLNSVQVDYVGSNGCIRVI